MINKEFIKEWESYVNTHPDLIARVIKIQEDKYASTEDIPIPEEAFADIGIEVLTKGGVVSRLGKSDERRYQLVRETLLSIGVTNI